ncbi:hypothetical protein E6P09_02565 [Haloferax mediterranei ATCC 33500]|uniref:Uncharacterized protein n=1 Tax=Haloferax mediterranei (strain ATCC 33500 / DSM 1411 / JCM 8866 / NBRC 14739 / NCIMB 2177 / R-4) TaxID=523841 RepID=I3R5L4_HALMT|nr:hypothetical protein [Haloferax mediterranei]AFK19524.1 hypothetical protein HFX_1826 [Haloferax mediterranei ATCC 33500]AHZ22919.1 hypothetical protein BM92_09850 [Haloferax mediterranei ATCC 33500]ELZ99844.1 hypothetical protein C439_10933 [Haloferax mediterranei ATCC 33500]MDX5987735.1 hypothetical protein [Haloferax mediterranei ATCC 33500]QCQ74214.1 hypothetical protein E6P09_02565 [Haloferax mediterranei ATCC 33500]
MQRRAAAISVVFFLVIGAGAYSLIATASTPSISFENPEYSLAQGDEFSVPNSDQTFTVSSITEEEESGGHGGGTTIVRSGELTYVNDSARFTETWDNASTITLAGTDYRVEVPNASNPSEATLVEIRNDTAILQNDPNADNQTVTRNGERYVVVNGSTLVPAGEYFPANETRTVAEGDSFTYDNHSVTVAAVETSGVTLEWFASEEKKIEVGNEANVTLDGQKYLAYFPAGGEEMVLTTNYDSYERQVVEIEQFHETENGLWGIAIVSFTAIVFLIGLAFLPSRY